MPHSVKYYLAYLTDYKHNISEKAGGSHHKRKTIYKRVKTFTFDINKIRNIPVIV